VRSTTLLGTAPRPWWRSGATWRGLVQGPSPVVESVAVTGSALCDGVCPSPSRQWARSHAMPHGTAHDLFLLQRRSSAAPHGGHDVGWQPRNASPAVSVCTSIPVPSPHCVPLSRTPPSPPPPRNPIHSPPALRPAMSACMPLTPVSDRIRFAHISGATADVRALAVCTRQQRNPPAPHHRNSGHARTATTPPHPLSTRIGGV